ncbi:MAG: hypothetical protein K2Y01_08785 [Rhabdochlamydiaceae bacterium]|nr:hypothetical protein [Rhabdochlamydiaceae bacterium]
MISALPAASVSPVIVAVSQSNFSSSLIHKVALSALSYLAASLYIPSSLAPVAICFIVGLTVALALFTSLENHQYEACPGHFQTPIFYPPRVYRPIFYRPVEVCRPPVSYPIYRHPLPPISFKAPLPATSFQPRMDRVGSRMEFARH